ncbi:tRNA pseudouridine(38-40) synthase TruA [Sphingobacterium sp. SGL-16]|uniref:tRNA pseudouridine(38-40) synthase TruA n=1 Tax=Sphingobacterium sp. SGL-16 TaxID=2710883 RepID=UPI0013EBB81B|nr:tRNA pseudouridine(38-40) synthase TruA [Sphingobacterium sp. SGL-16]NGM73705.1 tRNA pseudouridine(38-40) synthase TruA [Sphingobacterium sp. SGL-16]
MNNIKRFFLEIAYDGTAYHGWQIQPNAISVQEILNHALHTFLREEIETIGAGRTDTGVHSKQLYVHFDSANPILVDNPYRALQAINALLPFDISVKRIIEVAEDSHARFDASERSYEYHIHSKKNPFLINKSWLLRDIPDIEKMNEAARFLLGTKDFECFSKSNTQVFTNICTIKEARWEQNGDHFVFHITADRFLRNMVRAIVGTLLEIGVKGKPISYIQEVLESKNRSKAGVSVPAHGLYLTRVIYPYIQEK